MWKIGPECAAQQKKNVNPRMANCGVRSACVAVIPAAPAAAEGPPAPAVAGARRMSRAAGISSTQVAMPMVIIAVRQS